MAAVADLAAEVVRVVAGWDWSAGRGSAEAAVGLEVGVRDWAAEADWATEASGWAALEAWAEALEVEAATGCLQHIHTASAWHRSQSTPPR